MPCDFRKDDFSESLRSDEAHMNDFKFVCGLFRSPIRKSILRKSSSHGKVIGNQEDKISKATVSVSFACNHEVIYLQSTSREFQPSLDSSNKQKSAPIESSLYLLPVPLPRKALIRTQSISPEEYDIPYV
mmetsp:Transcript_42045/g.82463  ORF Transcript_42045/g.82463 Transcript_42045/m.82463 type:complete len:130 (+) Transcript_42045:168-557(+)